MIDKPKYWVYAWCMGTVVDADGFKVQVRGREHGVPHAHVWRGGRVAVIAIGSENQRPYLLERTTMGVANVSRAYRIVETNRAACLAEWRRLNG